MSSPDPLGILEVAERNELESLLMEFDGTWGANSLDEYGRRVASHSDPQYRHLALAELVKVDLHRGWPAGSGRLLDEYFVPFPSLGDADSVAIDLIVAEYEARSSIDSELALASYQSRFPKQFQQVEQLASELLNSDVSNSSPQKRTELEQVQVSVDTSRVDQVRDTKAGKKSDANVRLPVEFGRYRILKELGAGAMGKVYLAHDSQLDRQVALKTPSFSGPDDDDMVTRFYREARAAAKIQHRNICPVYDVGEIDGHHFISMAFIKGRCMSEFIKPDKLPPQRTSAILVQRLAVALAEAHKHNVIHRDLKPANIMIDRKKEPIVMDFGLARQTDVESRVTQSGMAVGTPAYMSPEQIRGELDEVGPTADIYALGVILYELLTGRLPFRGPIAKVVYGIVHEEPAAPSTIREGVDSEIESICTKMMAKERGERFQSMEDVALALKAYARGQNRASRAGASSTETSAAPSSLSSTGALTETGALNAFFAAQPEAAAGGTKIESAAQSIAAKDSKTSRQAARPATSGRSNGNHRRRRNLFIASGFAGGILLVFGVVIYFNGGKVELDDDSDAVVQVDDNGNLTIRPGTEAKLDSKKHAVEQAETSSNPGGTRAIAEQIVAFGGKVRLVDGGNWIETLPDGDLRIEGVYFFRKQREFDNGHLAWLAHLPELQTIYFTRNQMSDEGFVTLAEMENVVENVRDLRFLQAEFGPTSLAALAKLKRLETLALWHTELINDDLKLLANLPALKELTLQQYTKKKFGPAFLSDDCLNHLTAVRGLQKLTLIGQPFTDAGLVTLAELKIQELWLGTPNVTDLAITQLREQRPRLGVTRFKWLSGPETIDQDKIDNN